MIEGMPSARNSHCQPASPAVPESLSMISPEMGLPSTPETAMAETKSAVRVERNREGYHNVR